MTTSSARRVYVTGMGIICSIGASLENFTASLKAGRSGIQRLQVGADHAVRIGAMLDDFNWSAWLETFPPDPAMLAPTRKILRGAPAGTAWSVCAALQAVGQAGLPRDEDSERTGLIVAGSNLTQVSADLAGKHFYATGRGNPRHAVNYLDTNHVGALSEILGIRGPGMTIGAASASGNAALFQAFHWIRSGMVERCVVVGAGPHLSPVEREAFGALGAAFTGAIPEPPSGACRPFDLGHQGFVFGEGSACVVLESTPRHAPVLAELAGASLCLGANHLPDPDEADEIRAMRAALDSAGIPPDQIGYLNTHGTSSPLGDRTEAAAIKAVLGDYSKHAFINATKALTGHCFSAAGLIELVATIIQLQEGFAHPNPYLEQSIEPSLRWAGHTPEPMITDYALSNGFGFGGINSSVIIAKGNRHARRD